MILRTLAFAFAALVMFAPVGVSAVETSTTTADGLRIRIHTAQNSAVARAKELADKELARRIARLMALGNGSVVSAEIEALTKLRTKIAAEDATSTLKADISSITGRYNKFLTVVPQATIIAAAERVLTVAERMELIGDKLDARIKDEDVGSNTKEKLAEFKAKVAQAQDLAEAAIAEIKSLPTDSTDSYLASREALKGARQEVREAMMLLTEARKILRDLMNTIRKDA